MVMICYMTLGTHFRDMLQHAAKTNLHSLAPKREREREREDSNRLGIRHDHLCHKGKNGV